MPPPLLHRGVSERWIELKGGGAWKEEEGVEEGRGVAFLRAVMSPDGDVQ